MRYRSGPRHCDQDASRSRGGSHWTPVIGTIELVGLLRDQLHWTDAVGGWLARLDLNNVGFLIVGLFVVVWAVAIGYWKPARVESRWTTETAREP